MVSPSASSVSNPRHPVYHNLTPPHYSHLDDVPLPVQLGVLLHHPSPQRCAQESRRLVITHHHASCITVLKSPLVVAGRVPHARAA